MKIIFTICSNNYLAQAKVLLDSVLKYESDVKFIIGLVDQKDNEIDYSFFQGAEVLECDKIGIPEFASLWQKFNIIELNTAVKPFYIEYFFKNYEDVESVTYFDPDIAVFTKLDFLYDHLVSHDILLTPHILTPIPLDNKAPQENIFLNYGIYNLGFIALKNTQNVMNLVKWWQDRTYHKGFINEKEGLFVDQLWINFVHLFYKNVKILEHVGCNIAPWNLHERVISEKNNAYFINEKHELIFYHFSNYKPKYSERPFNYYTRFDFQNRPDLISLYQEYHKLILEANYEVFSTKKCFWVKKRHAYLEKLEAERIAALPKHNIATRAFRKMKRKFLAFWETP